MIENVIAIILSTGRPSNFAFLIGFWPVENLLFSGKRVTANILKGTDQIPEDFGTASGIMKSGLADITLESRKELKDTIVKLANIILKKEELKVSNEEEIKNRETDIKISSAS